MVISCGENTHKRTETKAGQLGKTDEEEGGARGLGGEQLESEEVTQRGEKQANWSCFNKVMGKEAGSPWEEVWVGEASPTVGFSPPLSRCS